MRPPVKLAALGVLALLLTAATPAWFNKGLYIPTVEDESTFPATSADTKGGIVFGSDAGIPYWSPGDGGAWQELPRTIPVCSAGDFLTRATANAALTCATPAGGSSDAGTTSGTVTSVSVVTANGVSGTVATATTTPAITISLGAISPSSINTGTVNGTAIKATTYLWSSGTFALGASGIDLISSTAPTIASGFGTSPTIAANGTAAFRITIGSPSASSGVLTMPASFRGWNCFCNDRTTFSSTVFHCRQSASSTTSVTLGNYDTTASAANWVAGDVLDVNCMEL